MRARATGTRLTASALILLASVACGSPARTTRAPQRAESAPRVEAPAPSAPESEAEQAPERAAPDKADVPAVAVSATDALDANDPRVQLYLVYGPCRQRLEERKLAYVVDEHLRERSREVAEAVVARSSGAANASEQAALLEPLAREEFERQRKLALDVGARVDAEYTRTLAEFAQRFPTLDTLTEIRRSFRSETWYRSQLNWTFVFDGLFLPDDETQRPDVTRAALQGAFGDQLVQWEKPWRGADGTIDPRYQATIRQIVRDHLFERAHFATTLAGPTWDVALHAGADEHGQPTFAYTTADAWKAVADTIAVPEVEDARAFWTNVNATRAALEREGQLLGADERDVAFNELHNELNDFVPTIEVLALEQERYASLEAFREVHGLEVSFRRRFDPLREAAKTALPTEIERHHEHVRARLSGVVVDADVLLVSAYDFVHARWKPDGRPGARARAIELATRWQANETGLAAGKQDAREREAFWNTLLDEQSEWWDPPLPEHENAAEFRAIERKHGRFGALDASRWLEVLELSRAELWLRGGEALDAILRDAPVGQLAGPFPHRYGSLLVRVRSRGEPQQPLDLSDAHHRDVLVLDYIDEQFRAYTRAAVEAARARPAK